MRVAVLGEALVDLVEADGWAYQAHLGGSPFNVCVGLSRQGTDVVYLSPLSEDRWGDRFAAVLAAEGVHLAARRRSVRPTSIALVAVDSAGQPSYRLYREKVADTDIDLQQAIDSIGEDPAIFHTGSLALSPGQLPMVRQLLAYCRGRGITTSVDINIRAGVSDDEAAYHRGVRSLASLCDIVKASDEDLAAMGLSAIELSDDMRGGVLLYTRGADGLDVMTPQGQRNIPSSHAGQLVDTVGAGDTFQGAFLAELLRKEKPLSEMNIDEIGACAEFGAAAAAINVTRAGCVPPSESEVRQLLRRL